MASVSKGKGMVDVVQWAKHLRPYWKRQQNKRVRQDGKAQAVNSQ